MDKEIQKDRKPVHVASTPKLIIGEEVMEDIRYINVKISREEWSGIAFYEVIEGDIENINSLVIELKYIWPMKKGNSASVEFDFDSDWIKIYSKLPELEDLKRGIIHSHNSMGAFHSGTDYKDLSTNCGIFDFYLSIVTNNRLHFDTKIAIPGEEEKIVESQYSFKNSFGKLIQGIFPKKEEVKEPIMLIHDVEVDTFIPAIDDSVFSERVEEIIKEEDEKPIYGYDRKFYRQEDDYDINGYLKGDYGLGKSQQGQLDLYEDNNSPAAPINDFNHNIADATLFFIDGGEEIIIHTLKSMGYLKIDARNIDTLEVMTSYFDSLEEKLDRNRGIIDVDLEKTLDTFMSYFIEGVKLLSEYKNIKDSKKTLSYVLDWLEIFHETLEFYDHDITNYLKDTVKNIINTYE